MRDQRLIRYARVNRESMSDAERLAWFHLRGGALGVRFRRQYPIGPYIADFACLSHRLVIELDGSQHRDSEYDNDRDFYMRRRGWTVLRFWSWDVIRNLESVMGSIADAVERRGDDDGVGPNQQPP